MKKWMLVVLAVALLSYSPVLAKDKKGKPMDLAKAEEGAQAPQVATPAATTQQDAARQELVANLNGMRNQELRVAILQQLLNEESSKLLNVQAVFCDRYSLDVSKWRQGMYMYDDKQQKFIEQQPQAK